jgi:ubiquinone/menaquinone biosynthesis C-methylase UbiE
MLKATGERLIPDKQREEILYAEHVARYRLAAQFARGRRVIDAGSGEGYGAAMLAAGQAAQVIGVDIDEAAVRHARDRYQLEFVQADLLELPFGESSFDLVVCFETIEHLAGADTALAELRRVLAPDGLLIISTPNSSEYLFENEFHEHEYTSAEFDQVLAGHFSERHRLYQQNWLLSAILDEHQLAADDAKSPLGVEIVKTTGLTPGRELYSVVICGPLEDAPFPVAVASGVYEANRLAAELIKAEEQRRAWHHRSTKAEQQRAAWQERATKAEENAEAWEQRAHEVERQVAELMKGISVIEASLSWRVTKPLRALKARLRRR